MQFLIEHTRISFDIWAVITLVVLICAVAVFIVRKINMKRKKDDLQDQIDEFDNKNPDSAGNT